MILIQIISHGFESIRKTETRKRYSSTKKQPEME